MKYQRIRDLREDRDMNQTQIAKELGMSQTGYSKYETGENDIPTAVLIKLARFYNTSIDYLLGETDNPKIRVVSSVCLRLLLFLPAILIPACAHPGQHFA